MVVMVCGGIGFVVFRIPKLFQLLMPGRTQLPRSKAMAKSPSLAFIRRTIAVLSKFGLRRESHQTPLEFAKVASSWLETRNFDPNKQYKSLIELTNDYYRIRYGELPQLSENEIKAIDQTIGALERFAVQMRAR